MEGRFCPKRRRLLRKKSLSSLFQNSLFFQKSFFFSFIITRSVVYRTKTKSFLFSLVQNEGKKKLTRRERQKHSTLRFSQSIKSHWWFYKSIRIILSPAFVTSQKDRHTPSFPPPPPPARERERERERERACFCARASERERKRERKRARVRNDPSFGRRRRRSTGIGYPLEKKGDSIESL